MRLRRLEPVLRLALKGPCALPAGSRLLVAVSGGADSTALLHALASLAREFDLALTAAHLHHGLRGADADGDLAHVRAACERLGVPLVAARWDTRARMRREGRSGEAGLRTLRRRFLRAAAARTGAAAIATAHTADDQLETVLMRLARGTGLAGLGGMRPRHGVWLKPLLGATRADVERDLAAARIAWREDASNATRDALRNRIRHDVVPALARAFAPGADVRATREGLARRAAAAAGTARDGAALAARVAARALARGADARALAALPAAARDAALRALWRAAAPGADALARRETAALARLLRAPEGRALALPGGRSARIERGRLAIGAPRTRPAANAILRVAGAGPRRPTRRRNAATEPGTIPHRDAGARRTPTGVS